ncbi:alpha/beta fold hydrolase [Eilatimonas milleporae]|uniref:Polyhydroxyalkanoate synthase n=1 Tax=Eilatimonas milleporae TaxID=911205 RepID=A0A3M0CHN7_9PROT|nr:alpha/beta fold hydrolase [Eilatimonas milleporae]RMB02713.1 polyhydroxyalkanoate synthase [Eilatimonas milleporae]
MAETGHSDASSGPARQKVPAVPTVLGPRPLPLHMANSFATWATAPAAAQGFLRGRLDFTGAFTERATVMRQSVDAVDDDDFLARIRAGAAARQKALLQGIKLFLNHPYERTDTPWRAFHKQGAVTIRDYGVGKDGPVYPARPVLLVPSLVNPSHILDLMPRRSLVAHLKARGFHPFVIDWGTPDAEEKRFGLDDYICRRLAPAIARVAAHSGRPVPVVGYCMGGTLSLAASLHDAARHHVSRLALLAAPWDFAAADGAEGENGTDRGGGGLGSLLSTCALPAIRALPEGAPVPVDLLQVFFALLDPMQNDVKFRRFAEMDMESEKAAFFVTLERWVNGGPPLARRVAEDCLAGWYGDNLPARGKWTVADRPVRPEDLACPLWLAVPLRDRLVPPGSALALAGRVAGAHIHRPGAGHVGMMVGSSAEEALWQPLCTWLHAGDPSHDTKPEN